MAMTDCQPAKSNLSLEEVSLEDVEKLAPLFARSFHPTSDYMKRAVPNTEGTRRWWADVHAYAVREPAVRIMKVVDTETGDYIALLRWRVHRKQDTQLVETWRHIPLSPECDAELCDAFIQFQHDSRAEAMGSRPHILVELLLTAHEHKMRGAAALLVNKMCQEANEEGLECFVETNGIVVKFYEKFGFQLRQTVDMPGGYGYTENILVRPPKIAKS